MISVSVRKKSVFGAMLLILACTLFAPVTAHAETNEISIQSITLSSTEGNAEEINPATTDGKKINLDIKLYDPGDSVTYAVEIKNNTDSNFYIDDESAKTTTDYLEYVFDYGNTRAIAAGQSRSINLVVTYKNKVPADQLENDQRVELDSLSLDFFEESDILVPNTIDVTLVIYSVIVIVSAAVLYKLFKAKKIFVCLILAMACVAAVAPAKANAVRECSIDVEARVTIDGKEAYFLLGREANAKMKEIAGTDISTDGYRTIDTNILAIKKSNTEPSSENKTANNIVSTDESSYPIYMWLDNGDLYWWSEDKTPNLNEDASDMFRNMVELLDIAGLADFDSGSVVTMFAMFASDIRQQPMKIASLKPLSKWDTSKVVSMDAMFQLEGQVTTLEGLEGWDVSNVENLSRIFSYMYSLTSVEALSEWDVTNVKEIRYILSDTFSLSTLDGLEKWDTSNIEDMTGAFMISASADQTLAQLKDIDAIRAWNTSNVTSMAALVQKQINLTNLDVLKGWDVSNVTDFMNFCSNCRNLNDVSAIEGWNIDSVTNVARMFNATIIKEINLSNFNFSQITTTTDTNLLRDCTSLERLKTPKIYPTDSAVKIKLPVTMYDADGNAYTQLDNTSPTEIWLTSTAP